MINFEELKKSSMPIEGACPGVYLLFSENELVYVGHSWNCLLRVSENTRKDSRKKFVRWNFIAIEDEAERKKIACEIISNYKPLYNT